MCHQHRITKRQAEQSNLNLVARELAKVRDKGLPEEEFNALVAQKKLELQKLFAALCAG